jgi:LPXTG-site transpeptidase (sortase) family protein
MYRSGNRRGIVPIIALIIVGVIAGGVYFLVDNLIVESPDQNAMPTVFAPPTWTPEGFVALPTQPINSAIPTIDPNRELPTLFIPNLGVVAPVVTLFIEDGKWDVDGLGPRVGHLQRTPWLNDGGNIVLAGHVEMQDGRLGIFSKLDNLQQGDSILLTEEQVDYRYAVSEIKYVQPDDLSVLYSTDRSTITLITCSDFNFFSQVYDRRLVVVAELISS